MDAALLDCDTHFTDHEMDDWKALPGWAALPERPEVVETEGRQRLRIGDRLFPRPSGPGHGNPKGLGHLIGAGHDDDRIEFMAAQGIAAAVLQPGFVGLSFHAVEDAGARTAIADAYNQLAARACAESAAGLRWGVLLSAEDPEWSAATLARYGTDPNVVGAVVRPTGRTPSARLLSPALAPVLDLLAAERLCLFLHAGTGCYQWSPLADAYAEYTMTHALGHLGEHMIGLADLLTRPDGLPDGLRVVMLESGTSWIPSFLERLDSHVRRLSTRDARPSELFGRHFALVPDPGERHARWAAEQLGPDSLLFGSDYPHWDTVRSDEWLAAFGDLCGPDTLRANTERVVPRLAAATAVHP
jgi:predicted TIM-barrel fold metal-dependent hydrolase